MTPSHSIEHLRRFGLVTGLMVGLMFGLLLPWLFGAAGWPWIPWAIGGVLAVLALTVPKALGPIERGWMKVGHTLGAINSRILLAVAYYVVVLPVGLVMRLVGRDPLARRLDKAAETYRTPSRRDAPREHMERPF